MTGNQLIIEKAISPKIKQKSTKSTHSAKGIKAKTQPKVLD